jgi:hypothetical protein
MTVTHPPPPLPLVAHGISDGQISISGNIFSFTRKYVNTTQVKDRQW